MYFSIHLILTGLYIPGEFLINSIVLYFFLIYFHNLFLIGMFRPFTFNVIIDIFGPEYHHFLFVGLFPLFSSLSSFLAFKLVVIVIVFVFVLLF